MTTQPADLREYLLNFYPNAPIPPLTHVVRTARPMVARINHGIWIASCDCGVPGVPSPGCVVWMDVPLGFCVRCLNRGWGGGWRPIILPGLLVREGIEEVLDFRPRREDQNWEPGESIDDLIRQNLDQGDPVAEVA